MYRRAIRKLGGTKNYFALRTQSDKTAIVRSVTENIYIRDNSFWLLICSVVIACTGLYLNSSVIIISALLLSPSSGPALGAGLGIGIFNKELLFESLKNFSIQIFITLLISYLYFNITGLVLPTEEILTYAEPGLFYIGISLIAGLASLIIISSHKDMMNVITSAVVGVVLTLPLCSAGFGLASSDTSLFKDAVYSFFINFMIILLAVFLMVRYINIPYKKYTGKTQIIRNRLAIAVVLALLTIPAVLISYNIVMASGERDMARKFINEHIERNNMNVVNWNIHRQRDDKVLTVYIASPDMNAVKQDTLNKILTGYISDAKLSIVPVEAGGTSGRYGDINNERLNSILKETGILQKRVDSISRIQPLTSPSPVFFDVMIRDLRVLFSNLDTIRIAYKGEDSIPAIAILWKTRKTENLMNENKIIEYVKQKMGFEKLTLMKGIYLDSVPGSRIKNGK